MSYFAFSCSVNVSANSQTISFSTTRESGMTLQAVISDGKERLRCRCHNGTAIMKKVEELCELGVRTRPKARKSKVDFSYFCLLEVTLPSRLFKLMWGNEKKEEEPISPDVQGGFFD